MDTGEKKSPIQRMHEDKGHEIIGRIKSKIDATKHNIEISEEIIAHTPYERERKRLLKRNRDRKHAVGSLEKEIRDVEQTIETRSREA